MNDDRIKSIFEDFEPNLTSDTEFINSLQQRLDSVEVVKQHLAEVKLRNKRAMAIAACAGFIVGFLFAFTLPQLTEMIAQWQLSMPSESRMNIIAGNVSIVAWTVIAGISVLTTLSAYKIALSTP